MDDEVKRATPEEMLAAVKAHAATHYEENGWDYVVECWDDAEILSVLSEEKAETIETAIAAVGEIVELLDERRRDVEAEIF